MVTKLNVNIRTLLLNCEELAKHETNYWRLKKFIKSIETMIQELEECDDNHSQDKILDYTKRLQALKMLTNYIESPPSTQQRKSPAYEYGDLALKEVQQLEATKKYTDLRKELMNEETLRHRKTTDATDTVLASAKTKNLSATSEDNMNAAVKFYNDTQEKITEHMISLTRNLKEQTETANRIIRKDTETVGRSTGIADRNINSLNKESEKLAHHSRNAWKCWMWLMIIFVIFVFIGMVLFMKIMKKRKS